MELDDPVLKVETKEPTCRAQHEIGHHYSLREQYRSQQLAAAQMHHMQQLCKQLGFFSFFRVFRFQGLSCPAHCFVAGLKIQGRRNWRPLAPKALKLAPVLGSVKRVPGFPGYAAAP